MKVFQIKNVSSLFKKNYNYKVLELNCEFVLRLAPLTFYNPKALLHKRWLDRKNSEVKIIQETIVSRYE